LAFLLNTNSSWQPAKGHLAVVEALRSLAPSDLLLSSVVLGELETGVIQRAWPERNRRQLLALVEDLQRINWLR
jgi:hypothetical protein